jgi:hypothetical protein
VASILTEQFRVPVQESLTAAEKALDAQLIDPLGGKYELSTNQSGSKQWRSSKLAAGAPANYQFPALAWIRGMDLEGRLEQGQVVIHAEVDMPLDITVPGQANAVKPGGAPAQPEAVKPAPAAPAPPKPGPVPPARPTRAKQF